MVSRARRFLRRPSPAMVVALIGVFLALGGPAYTAGTVKRALFAKKARNADRVDGFHASATPKPGRLLPLGANGRFPAAVLPPTGLPSFYTKGESDARYLAKGAMAANADKLDGSDSAAYQKGCEKGAVMNYVAVDAKPGFVSSADAVWWSCSGNGPVVVTRSNSTTYLVFLPISVHAGVGVAESSSVTVGVDRLGVNAFTVTLSSADQDFTLIAV